MSGAERLRMEDEDIFVYKQVSSWDTDDVIKWMNGSWYCIFYCTGRFNNMY